MRGFDSLIPHHFPKVDMHEVEFIKSDVDLAPADDKVEYEIVGVGGVTQEIVSPTAGPSTNSMRTALDQLSVSQLARLSKYIKQQKNVGIAKTELAIRTKKNRKKAKLAASNRKRNRG